MLIEFSVMLEDEILRDFEILLEYYSLTDFDISDFKLVGMNGKAFILRLL